MNSKFHLITSIIKSLIRILSCILAISASNNSLNAITYLAVGFGIAEILGLAEEFGDKR